MRAFLNLRHGAGRLHDAFASGLRASGYRVVEGVSENPSPGDILITWNLPLDVRIVKDRYTNVLVVENASWGNDFLGERWRHIALRKHNTARRFPVGDASRWDSLGVQLPPFREQGETVILAQRGIGPPGIAMPKDWLDKVKTLYPRARIRQHPGRVAIDENPLEQDLKTARKVVTWGSGAAVKALLLGCHVESHMPKWIAEQDNTIAGRLAMFRRLAWAQWRFSEIEAGDPFRWLLNQD